MGNSAQLRKGIVETARTLGVSPADLATVISYETAGTFNPTIRGPVTQWKQHRGLIQWGEPQAKEFGVDWNDPIGSQLGANGAIVRYMRKAGVKPGMGLLDLYSAVNAGHVGRYNASDANNGGAPGSVRDKVQNQMAGHKRKAAALLGNAISLENGAEPATQPGLVSELLEPASPEKSGGPSIAERSAQLTGLLEFAATRASGAAQLLSPDQSRAAAAQVLQSGIDPDLPVYTAY